MSKPKPIAYVANFTKPKPATVETNSIRPITHAWRAWWREHYDGRRWRMRFESGFSKSRAAAVQRAKEWCNHLRPHARAEVVEARPVSP